MPASCRGNTPGGATPKTSVSTAGQISAAFQYHDRARKGAVFQKFYFILQSFK
jgi:hypothetical protein